MMCSCIIKQESSILTNISKRELSDKKYIDTGIAGDCA
jgi:hypothetical protein